jgi:lipid-A-disaccharide synthase
MRIFFSVGEPSGDLHGANLIRAFHRLCPEIECVGFGGERMEAAGCRLLYPLCRLAVMWFLRVLTNAPTFFKLLAQADRFFRDHRPDAVVLIDYPGFNWEVARRAHTRGIPVFYFVPPQLWAWAGWRVRKMRRWVDHVLCSLPFEQSWYRQRGVRAHYVGHPYFDELPRQRLDPDFVKQQQARGGDIVGLLPGSRNQEIQRNLPMLIETAARIHRVRPQTRFLVACFNDDQRALVDASLLGRNMPIETFTGRTPEIIHLSRSCVAVSGSVGLELLYHGKPSVVVYRIGRLDLFLCRRFKTSRFISLVNLLAEKELFPEFLTDRCRAEEASGHLLRWLSDPAAYAEVCAELARLRQRVGEQGACERTARYVLERLENPAACGVALPGGTATPQAAD